MAAHKNECPGGAGQVVKTLSKRTIDFIAIVARVTSIDVAFTLLWLTIGAQLTLLIWEVLK